MKKLDRKRLAGFLLCVGIPLIILLALTIDPLMTLMNGKDILLKTRPIDPRDVFRGDYVALNYEISEIAVEKLPESLRSEAELEKNRNTTLYVVLKKDGDYHVIDRVTTEKPKDGIYLRAKYSHIEWTPDIKEPVAVPHIYAIVVSYNLDQYFVPENTGSKLEELSRKGALTAKVRVWNGYSLLLSVF